MDRENRQGGASRIPSCLRSAASEADDMLDPVGRTRADGTRADEHEGRRSRERKGSTVASDGTQGVQVNTTLIGTGAVLALLGSVLIALGMALAGTAIIAAAREWTRLQETPPSQVARLKLQQLRTAASAGADAWRSGQSPS